jgi:hypothetical protein
MVVGYYLILKYYISKILNIIKYIIILSEIKMNDLEQKDIYVKQVKKFIKQNDLHFIRNNERFRAKLNMNRAQLSLAIRYLKKIGYLQNWNKKVYKILTS